MHDIKFKLNGEEVTASVPAHHTLLTVVHETLGLTGTKEGCGDGDCGACTMLVNGETVCSCLMLAVEADGANVITIEGLAKGEQLNAVQAAFIEESGLQCGFCTPGMIMSATSLLEKNPNPTDDEIKVALEGNLCRCTGYDKIINAVRKAAEA